MFLKKIFTNPDPNEASAGVALSATISQYVLCSLIVIFIFFVLCFVFPPYNFPAETYFRVRSGEDAGTIAQHLWKKNLISSPKTFKLVLRLLGGHKDIKAGSYYFNEPISSFAIAFRLINRNLGQAPYRVTFFEGASVKKVAKAISQEIPNFNEKSFIALGTKWEGYLFPDTYFFSKIDGPIDMLEVMKSNFDEKIVEVKDEIKKTGKSLNEIITMASIIDREVKTPEDRRIVSGILWKRIAAGMPLQVDATFEYYLNKKTSELTKIDLKSESPYNTYTNKGLPPTPIGNPGWDAILAAINPEESDYWFYLSDKEGLIHYAKNFDEHKANRKKYGI